jgi:hypothetical protein
MERFRGGWRNVNEVCSGQPWTVTCIEVTEQIDQLIWHNGRIIINNIAHEGNQHNDGVETKEMLGDWLHKRMVFYNNKAKC